MTNAHVHIIFYYRKFTSSKFGVWYSFIYIIGVLSRQLSNLSNLLEVSLTSLKVFPNPAGTCCKRNYWLYWNSCQLVLQAKFVIYPFAQEYLLSCSTSYHSEFCYKITLNFAILERFRRTKLLSCKRTHFLTRKMGW